MIRAHFDSIADLATAPFTLPSNERRFNKTLFLDGRWYDESRHAARSTRRTRSVEDWYGAPTEHEAAARVTRGWPEGAARVLKALAELDVPAPVSVRRRLARADQGDEVDIHAVNRGNLETAWTTRRRRHARGSTTVRLIVQLNLLESMQFEQLFWRGAAVVRLADALTAAGYSVEVVGAIASYNVGGIDDGTFLATVMLKEASTPLDIESLAGTVCNAGFHRLFGFRLYFALAPDRHPNPGAARSDVNGDIIAEAKPADGVATFVTPYALTSPEKASAWAAGCVAALDASHHEAPTT